MNFIRKNFKHFMNFFNYIFEHLLCIIILIVVFVLSFFVLKMLPCSMPTDVQAQEIYVFDISLTNLGIWFTAIGLIVAACWSMYQFTKNKILRQQEKAVEVAKLFSEDILIKLGIITSVILNSELGKIINPNNFKYTDFKNFDKNEIVCLYEDDEIFFKIRENLKSEELQQAYLKYIWKRISLTNDNLPKEYIFTTEEAHKIFKLNNKELPFRFTELITNTLNSLEYICMNLSSQAAGSQYVYQSLHQIFLLTVKTLAPIISLNNSNHFDKYYTNIVHVYNYWCTISIKEKNKENERIKKIERTLNPKIETV